MYPEETIVESKGKKEVRILQCQGAFAIYQYENLETGKTETKYSILLKEASGKCDHLIVVPTARGQELIVKREENCERKALWDKKAKKTVWFG